MQSPLEALITILRQYVRAEILGKVAVDSMNDFVGDDHVYDLKSPYIINLIDELQDASAYYVADPTVRLEHSRYKCNDEFLELINEFLKSLHKRMQ